MQNSPIHHTVEQNTEEWFNLRAGIPTASAFDKILTPAKLEPSKQAEGYMHHLLAERLAGRGLEFQSEAMKRGHEYEPEARKAFELMSGRKTQPGGFWTTADGSVGCSPDGLDGPDDLLELKCPNASTHIAYMLSKQVDREYYVQLQGQLYVTGRKAVTICSYYPDLPLVTIRVERNEADIEKIHTALVNFTKALAEAEHSLAVTV